MLVLTDNASAIVQQLTAEVPGEQPGLRIVAGVGESPDLQVTASGAAEPGDQVVEQDGATVYVEPRAAEVLDTMVLDAGVDTDGNVSFALGQQD